MYKYESKIKVDDNITLRQITLDDFDDIYHYSSDRDFTIYLPFVSTKENTISFINNINNDIKNHKRLYWGIEIDDKIIGTIGFLNLKKTQAEIGFGISKDYWGTGIIQICVEFLINYAKINLNINQLIVGTHKENKRSINFIKKFQFIETHQTVKDIYFRL